MNNSTSPGCRTGMTLVELVVVIAIIAILAGLLLPAVQNVRDSAECARCVNNLKQISLAAHLYHDAAGGFPPAFRTRRPGEPMPYLHWFPRLLPYLEQDALWRQTESDYSRDPNPFATQPAHSARDVVVRVFGCPADYRVQTSWTITVFGQEVRTSLTSYLGNAGMDTRSEGGTVFRDSRVNLLAVQDGSSNTLFAGERPPSPDLIYGWWYTGMGQDGLGSLDSVIGARERNVSVYPRYRRCGPGPFQFRPGRLDDPCATFHYWSLHPGGANFAFCDGSVRFLSYSADTVLPALATRAGGESVAIPD